MRAEEIERARQSLAQRRGRLPSELVAHFGEFRVVVADVDRLAIGGEGNEAVGATTVELDQQLREPEQRDMLVAPEVVDLPARGVISCAEQESLDGVVNVCEIAPLSPAPVHENLLSREDEPNPSAEK